MYDFNDTVEFSNRMRVEDMCRGFEWNDVIKNTSLTEKDMLWAKFPTDEDYRKNRIRGLAIGNYFKWDPNKNTKMIKEKYNWTESQKPFERTYRRMSNLDDRYENGIHDLLKFIKWNERDILLVNKFGIPEPLYTQQNYLPDVVLVPLLAFDANKNRLGYGKGFYDKFLNEYIKWQKDILTVGVAFSFQKHHNLPVKSNDFKLDCIITEKGLIA